MDLKKCPFPFKPFSLHIVYKPFLQVEAIAPHYSFLLLHNEQLPRSNSSNGQSPTSRYHSTRQKKPFSPFSAVHPILRQPHRFQQNAIQNTHQNTANYSDSPKTVLSVLCVGLVRRHAFWKSGIQLVVPSLPEQNVCFSFQSGFSFIGNHDDDYLGYEQDCRQVPDLPRFSVHNRLLRLGVHFPHHSQPDFRG